MKKIFYVALAVFLSVTSCQDFDDSAIWNKLNDHESRIAYLEDVCKQINTDIVNLQTIVTALETNDYIVNASQLVTGDGYTFIFKSGKSVVIYNGKDGKDGTNGKDGVTPTISVMKDVDGVYYWTVNGEWLLINGQKVKASATDGKDGNDGMDGEDGKNGVTPKFKLEEDYWFVSYDDGKTWEKLGKATGNDGLNGEDGDAFFKAVLLGDGFVIFTLNDGKNTQIQLPFVTDNQLSITLEHAGTLKDKLTLEEQRSSISIKLTGEFNNDDLIYINTYLRSLELLDLSNAIFNDDTHYGAPRINPLKETAINRTLRHVIWGSNTVGDPEREGVMVDPSYCLALETLTLTTNYSVISKESIPSGSDWPKQGGVLGSPNLSKIIIAEGVTELYVADKYNAYCAAPIVEFPMSLTKVGLYIFGLYKNSTIICNAITPPKILAEDGVTVSSFYDAYNQMKSMILYVPVESLDTYKSNPGWSKFGTILPIEK